LRVSNVLRDVNDRHTKLSSVSRHHKFTMSCL